MSYYGFGMHFIDDLWCWATFFVCVGCLNILFKKISIQVLCSFKSWIIFLVLWWMSSLYTLDSKSLSDISFKIFFLFHKQAFLFFFFGSFLLLCQSLLVSCKQEWGLPWWLSSKEFSYQCRKRGFNHGVRKTPWRRKWEPILVVLPGKPHGPGNPVETPEEPGRL